MPGRCLQLIAPTTLALPTSHLACRFSPGSDSGCKADRCVREYFQNKILEIFLSPVGFYTSGQDSSALGRGCINEIRKTRYNVYIGAIGKLCACTLPSMVISPGYLECTDEPRRGQIPSANPPNTIVLERTRFSIASRGCRRPEPFPKTAIYCHLLPFWSRKTATPDATVPFASSFRVRAGQPGTRAENRERGPPGASFRSRHPTAISYDRRVTHQSVNRLSVKNKSTPLLGAFLLTPGISRLYYYEFQ